MTEAHLEIVLGEHRGDRFRLIPGASLCVGRSAGVDATIQDLSLSSRHFEIFWKSDRPWVRDLGSTNGTHVNAMAVTEGELRHGDEIAAGSHRFRVYFPPPQGGPVAGPPPLPPVQPAPAWPQDTRAADCEVPAAKVASGRHRWLLVSAAVAGGLGLLAVVGLALTAVLLVGTSGRWDLLPSMVKSVFSNGWSGRLQPAAGLTTGSPSLDSRPHPAVRLTAPAGALDTARDFRVTELNEEQLDSYAAASPMGLMLPLAGFQLESGMAPRDLFPGTMTVTLDLAELDLPEGSYDLVDIFHIDVDGALRRQLVRRNGRKVAFDLRHNGPILVGALAVAVGALFSKEQATKWGGVGNWLAGRYWFYDYKIYRVWYPGSLAWRQSPELLKVRAELEERWKANRPRSGTARSNGGSEPPPSGSGSFEIPEDRDERREWVTAFYSDRQVQDLMRKKLKNPSWVRKNALPFQVAHVVDSLERAHHYLFSHRKFRPPSLGSVDVILLNDWAKTVGGGTEFGFSSDGYFTYPYIQVNGDKVPKEQTPSPVLLDSIDTTVLHELFHVAQKEYFNWSKYLRPSHVFGGARYTWFMEATALVLEEDAKPYYAKPYHTTVKKWTRTHFETTFDVTEHLGYFKLQLDAAGETEKATQRKGYAASRFLLDLQNRYYSSNRDAFLPTFLGAFCSFSNPTEVLINTTSSNAQVLGADYLLFSSRNARGIAAHEPKVTKGVLSPAHPVSTWTLDPAPLSTPFHQLDFNSPSPEQMKKGMIVLRTHRLDQYGVVTRYSLGGDDFETVRDSTGTVEIPTDSVADGDRSLLLQRVETYTDTPWSMGSVASYFGGEAKTTAVLMVPPTKAPKLELLPDTKKLRISLGSTPLWRAGELKEFQVRIEPPKAKALTFAFGAKTAAEIPWSVVFYAVPDIEDISDVGLRTFLVQQDLIDMHAVWNYLTTVIEPGELKIKVRYREVLKTNPDDPPDVAGIDGPWSKVFEVPIDRNDLGNLNYNVGGTWSGTAMLLHDPVKVKLSQHGADIEGTCSFAGTVYRLEGDWRPEEKGWEVQMLVATNDGLAASLVTPYMRRMAGEELWLAWPACVLRRDPPPPREDEEARGWFDRLLGR